jgi:site-specific recombinase XerD
VSGALERRPRAVMGSDMTDANEITFRGLARKLDAQGASPRSVAIYHAACLSLECYLRTSSQICDLLAVTPGQVTGWLSEIRARGGWSLGPGGVPAQRGRPLSKGSVHTYFISVRRFYNWAAGEGLIDSSPMTGLKCPPAAGGPISFPETDDVRAVLATCRPKNRKPGFTDLRDEFIIRAFCEPGAPRCSELALLELERLDMRHDSMLILGKGGKWRTVPMSATTATAAQRYLRARQGHRAAHLPWVLLGQFGQLSPGGVYKVMVRRGELAGIKGMRPHRYRHYAAHRSKEAGMSSENMMMLFGWSTARMAERYGRALAGERAIEEARRLRIGDRL